MNKPLLLENLVDYDQGALQVLFDQAMRSVFLDLEDRPNLSNARKVTLEFEFKPLPEKGDLAEVECTAKVKASIPHKETRSNTLLPSGKNGALMFNPHMRRASDPALPLDYDD